MTVPVEPGELVGGKYEILGRIGKGGMGVVFEARHATIGRRLAVKFLRADLALDDRKLLRFQREARACGALHHENVAAVLDFATDELGRPYIVMEFVDGLSLRELLAAHGPMDAKRSCNLICQAARGLSAAHQAGILHRDLKPENLMVTRRGDGSDWLKLLDFGVARLMEDEETTVLTRDGHAPGTPHYLSPEIARGESPASVQSDVYSLGVVLFELLTGQRPHSGESHNAVIHQIAQHPAPLIERLKPDLAAPLARVIDRTLSRDPADRPQSALELVQALQSAGGDKAPVIETPTVTSSHPIIRHSAGASGNVASASPSVRAVGDEGHARERRLFARAWPLLALPLVVGAIFVFFELRPASRFELDPGGPTKAAEATSLATAPVETSVHPIHSAPTAATVQVPSVSPKLPSRSPASQPSAPIPVQRAPRASGSTLRSSSAPQPVSPIPSHRRLAVPAGSFDRENPFRD